jgi:hypothetical protein
MVDKESGQVLSTLKPEPKQEQKAAPVIRFNNNGALIGSNNNNNYNKSIPSLSSQSSSLISSNVELILDCKSSSMVLQK